MGPNECPRAIYYYYRHSLELSETGVVEKSDLPGFLKPETRRQKSGGSQAREPPKSRAPPIARDMLPSGIDALPSL